MISIFGQERLHANLKSPAQLVDFLPCAVASRHEICRVVFSGFAAYFPVMSLSVEQIAEEALSLPSEARVLLADRLVESLDSVEDEKIHRLWAAEALRRRDEVRSGRVKTIPSNEALKRVRKAVAR